MAPQLAVTAAAGTEFFCSPKRREMQKVGNAKGKAHQGKGLSMSPQALGTMSHWQVSLAQGAYGDVRVTQAPESSPARYCSAVGLLHLPHLHSPGWSGKDGGASANTLLGVHPVPPSFCPGHTLQHCSHPPAQVACRVQDEGRGMQGAE